MAQLELDEQFDQAAKFLNDLKEGFDRTLEEKLSKSVEEKEKNFDELRPTLGHPARKTELEQLDQREKQRLDTIQQGVTQLRTNTKVRSRRRNVVEKSKPRSFRKTFKPTLKRRSKRSPVIRNVCSSFLTTSSRLMKSFERVKTKRNQTKRKFLFRRFRITAEKTSAQRISQTATGGTAFGRFGNNVVDRTKARALAR